MSRTRTETVWERIARAARGVLLSRIFVPAALLAGLGIRLAWIALFDA
ncbi:MAG: hypothetical protein HY775_06100 [Acidobacteria bacterium]|nr:hypothetical protein [Acidobacteriota bacterium]